MRIKCVSAARKPSERQYLFKRAVVVDLIIVKLAVRGIFIHAVNRQAVHGIILDGVIAAAEPRRYLIGDCVRQLRRIIVVGRAEDRLIPARQEESHLFIPSFFRGDGCIQLGGARVHGGLVSGLCCRIRGNPRKVLRVRHPLGYIALVIIILDGRVDEFSVSVLFLCQRGRDGDLRRDVFALARIRIHLDRAAFNCDQADFSVRINSHGVLRQVKDGGRIRDVGRIVDEAVVAVDDHIAAVHAGDRVNAAAVRRGGRFARRALRQPERTKRAAVGTCDVDVDGKHDALKPGKRTGVV